MTQIVLIKRKHIKPAVVREEPAKPFGIVWQEIGGAQYDDPTWDRDEVLDAVAFDQWQLDQIDGE